MNLAARFAALGTATIGEAVPSSGLVALPLRPLVPEMKAAGFALTVRCRPGDNLALHRALALAQRGDILVVDYGGSVASGPFGEIMARASQVRGIAGLVIDGTVRDGGRLVEMGFPVFSRGLNIRGTTKLDPGEIGGRLDFGGIPIERGDIVVADADAVVVVPAAEAETALAAGEARVSREAEILKRVEAGETTLQILGLAGASQS